MEESNVEVGSKRAREPTDDELVTLRNPGAVFAAYGQEHLERWRALRLRMIGEQDAAKEAAAQLGHARKYQEISEMWDNNKEHILPPQEMTSRKHPVPLLAKIVCVGMKLDGKSLADINAWLRSQRLFSISEKALRYFIFRVEEFIEFVKLSPRAINLPGQGRKKLERQAREVKNKKMTIRLKTTFFF